MKEAEEGRERQKYRKQESNKNNNKRNVGEKKENMRNI